MPDSPPQRIPPDAMQFAARGTSPHPPPGAHTAHLPVFVVFLVWWVFATVALVAGLKPPEGWEWLEGVLYVLASAALLVGMARRLPLQNVASVGMIVAAISAVVVTVGSKTGVPFGGITYTDRMGPLLIDLLPWALPFFWVAVVLSSRGVARLLLRPWRRGRRYGYLLLTLTAFLALLADLAFEPFAVQFKRYWSWKASSVPWDWYGAPWSNFVAWVVLVAAILAFAGPWLFTKRAVPQSLDFYPLLVWVGLMLYVTAGNAMGGLWCAAGVGLAAALGAGLGALAYGRQPAPVGPPRRESMPKEAAVAQPGAKPAPVGQAPSPAPEPQPEGAAKGPA